MMDRSHRTTNRRSTTELHLTPKNAEVCYPWETCGHREWGNGHSGHHIHTTGVARPMDKEQRGAPKPMVSFWLGSPPGASGPVDIVHPVNLLATPLIGTCILLFMCISPFSFKLFCTYFPRLVHSVWLLHVTLEPFHPINIFWVYTLTRGPGAQTALYFHVFNLIHQI